MIQRGGDIYIKADPTKGSKSSPASGYRLTGTSKWTRPSTSWTEAARSPSRLPDPEAFRAVMQAASRPVNLMALGAVMRAEREMAEHDTFVWVEETPLTREVNGVMQRSSRRLRRAGYIRNRTGLN